MNHLAAFLRAFQQLRQKLLHGRARYSLLLRQIHAVAMQFDEEPVRSSRDRNRSFLPEFQTPQAGRIAADQRCILDSNYAVAGACVEVRHQRPLHHQRKNLRNAPHAQITPFAMRCALIKPKTALVERIHFADLCRMKPGSGHGEVCVAAGLGKNLHFAVHAAGIAPCRICQGKVPMDEGVPCRPAAIEKRKRTVIHHQRVAEIHQQLPRVLGAVGRIHTMVEVNFKFTPSFVAMLRQPLHQPAIILLRRIKVCMYQRTLLVIAPRVHCLGIFRTPALHAALLLRARRAGSSVVGHNRGLEMIGQNEDQVHLAAGRGTGQTLPGIRRQPSAPGNLARQALAEAGQWPVRILHLVHPASTPTLGNTSRIAGTRPMTFSSTSSNLAATIGQLYRAAFSAAARS